MVKICHVIEYLQERTSHQRIVLAKRGFLSAHTYWDIDSYLPEWFEAMHAGCPVIKQIHCPKAIQKSSRRPFQLRFLRFGFKIEMNKLSPPKIPTLTSTEMF